MRDVHTHEINSGVTLETVQLDIWFRSVRRLLTRGTIQTI